MAKKRKETSNSRESKATRQLRYYYENIIAKMPGHVFWKDRNSIFLGCNDQQAKTLGLSSWREVIGKTTYDMVWHDQPESERRKQATIIDEHDRAIMESGVAQILEEPLILPDGSKAIYLSNKTPLFDEDGNVTGILGVSFDITELRKTEKKLQETEQRLAGMTVAGASIAHELRTPLSAINIGSQNIKKMLPLLIDAYQLALHANLPVQKLTPIDLKLIESYISGIESETMAALTFINMLLMNISFAPEPAATETFSIAKCVDEALSRYPLKKEEKALIHWDPRDDFIVKGKQLLVIHILFNLLKNALHFITKSNKSDAAVYINLESGKAENKLYFKDTGTGIATSILPHLFERFFTQTPNGAGIGLTFCKMVMESLGGTIACESKENDYTLFILVFPVVKD